MMNSMYILFSVRMILFCLVWVVTMGRHHFWFLPNLTEDVGFFDSFKPLYQHTDTKEESKKSEEKSKKDKSEKKDGGGDEKSNEDKSSGKNNDEDKNGDEDKSDQDEDLKDKEETGSELENDNGYEIVDPEDIQDEDMVDEEEEEDDEPKKTKWWVEGFFFCFIKWGNSAKSLFLSSCTGNLLPPTNRQGKYGNGYGSTTWPLTSHLLYGNVIY